MSEPKRVALVTGGGRGLGRAMSLALLDAGHDVVLASGDETALAAVVAEAAGSIGRAVAIPVDLAAPGAAERLADAALAAFGRIDMLVNNAGIGLNVVRRDYLTTPYRFWHSDRALLDHFFQVNAIAPLVLANRLAPAMIGAGWGRIVCNTTSLDSMLRFPLYGGSKAALEAETAVMANDLAGTGVTANVLVPGGGTATRMTDEVGIPRDLLFSDTIMAGPILYLASDDSNGFNGRRLLANRWDGALPVEEAAQVASDLIAWTGIGSAGVHPVMAMRS